MSNHSRRRNKVSKTGPRLSFELLEAKRVLAANFVGFSALDASQDLTATTVFESGALSLDFEVELDSGTSLQAVEIFAQNGSNVLKIGEYFSTEETGALISLDGFSSLSGTQEIFGVASTSDGQHATSSSFELEVLATTTEVGNFRGTDFDYQGASMRPTWPALTASPLLPTIAMRLLLRKLSIKEPFMIS